MSEPLTIVVGTRNKKKGREIATLISPPWEHHPRLARLVARTLDEWPDLPEVIEDTGTFAGNAGKKASETAKALGLWVVADDSGLAVNALGGAPGVDSAIYAGTHGEDEANNRLLVANMAEVPDERRSAAFICTLALADPSGSIRLEAEGKCRGRLTREPRGERGFGYDPLFLIPEYHRTFGELSPLVKAHLSHRARAFARLRMGLDRLIAKGEFNGHTRGRMSITVGPEESVRES
jgi:XTP/dITP diphosphohydrolase